MLTAACEGLQLLVVLQVFSGMVRCAADSNSLDLPLDAINSQAP
jgi:hypothetical protein